MAAEVAHLGFIMYQELRYVACSSNSGTDIEKSISRTLHVAIVWATDAASAASAATFTCLAVVYCNETGCIINV